MEGTQFLKQKSNYRTLICYKKAECIYDITYYFAHKYLKAGDRTIDQMVQAARSGKQNIVEGESAATTSVEMELKLLNVARASLQELLIDYEDYLRVRGLELWDRESPKGKQCRAACKSHDDSAYYREAIRDRSEEAVANIAIVLIHQTDYLLMQLFNLRKQEFLDKGGIREEMTRERLKRRSVIK